MSLFENSKSYYQENNFYKLFSDAEDYPNFIWEYLNKNLNGNILDLGCGNGKYLKKISTITENFCGVDKSLDQLKLIDAPLSKKIYNSDAEKLPFTNNFFDCILSCWMIGTIKNIDKQLNIINESLRTLKSGGSFFLIENDIDSDFEKLRGRDSLIDSRTQNYNNFLIEKGFIVDKKIDTYFQFKSKHDANIVFKSIWGDNLTNEIQDNKIQHSIIIFKYCKK